MNTVSFSHQLIKWYKKAARDLPWRRTNDPYKIWVSEVMLQQTTVTAVIPFYEKWVKRFPDVRTLAKAHLQTVLTFWQGLGYYQRARNLHKAAKIIEHNFNGIIPSDVKELKSLPGFGPYTTGAVASIAFGQRIPIIDANVRRVIMRILALEEGSIKDVDDRIYRFLDIYMPQQKMSEFNQGLMELGALICRGKEPTCTLCPVSNHCEAYIKGIQELIPKPKKSIIQHIQASVAIIEKNKKVLIQKRPSKGLLADLWEFPGGKLELGEDPKTAVIRELSEELNVSATSVEWIMQTHHYYTKFKVKLDVFKCDVSGSIKSPLEIKWVPVSKLNKYPMPSGSAKIVNFIQGLDK